MYGSILRYFKTQKRFNAATNGAAEKLSVYQGQFIGREHDGRGDAVLVSLLSPMELQQQVFTFVRRSWAQIVVAHL